YYWRVLAAQEIMRLYRQNPAALERLNGLETGYGSAEAVLHPPGSTPVFANAAAVKQALSRGALVKVPDQPGKRHFTLDRAAVGSSAALRPEALALLYYLGDRVHAISHQKAPLTVGATARDGVAQQALVARRAERPGYAVATTGYSFDIERRYASQAQAEAFQAMLDRLQALDVIAWERRPNVIHITVSSYAKPLTPLLHGASLGSDA